MRHPVVQRNKSCSFFFVGTPYKFIKETNGRHEFGILRHISSSLIFLGGASYDEVGGQRRRRLLPPIFRMPALPPRRSEVERDDVREWERQSAREKVAVLMVFWDCLWMMGLFYSYWSCWIGQSQSDKTVSALRRLPREEEGDTIRAGKDDGSSGATMPAAFPGSCVKSTGFILTIGKICFHW